MKERIKNEVGKEIKELIVMIGVVRAIMDSEVPGSGDIFLDVLIEEIGSLKAGKPNDTVQRI